MSPQPFIVNIAALRPTPGSRHHVVRAGRLEGLMITSSAVTASTDVVVDADLEVVDGGVVITGTVSSTWVGECRRCLRPVTGELEAKVREVFERVPRVRGGDPGDVDEADTYPLTGDTLDLAPLARDAVLLELPLAPLCRADCAGLCSVCGADLTEQPCECADLRADSVWAVLESLDRAPDEVAGETAGDRHGSDSA